MVRSTNIETINHLDIIRDDLLNPQRMSMKRLSLDLRVPVTRIAEIVHERRSITPDTALRLARYFSTSARFWLNAQAMYDLEVAQDELQASIQRDVRPLAGPPQVRRD
ncbi:MAG: HigA family addiction module antitoxin [Terriglobales bacterium]